MSTVRYAVGSAVPELVELDCGHCRLGASAEPRQYPGMRIGLLEVMEGTLPRGGGRACPVREEFRYATRTDGLDLQTGQ